MKRGTRLKRTPLRRGTAQLSRTSPLRRVPFTATPAATGNRLERRKPLRPVSRKRAAENRERRAMADRRYGPERPLCAFPGPPHWADAFHEPLTRARGGSITAEGNTVPMCNEHNQLLAHLPDSELGWAYKAGLLKHSWEVAS